MYIITDTFNGGEHTPQIANTLEEAKIIFNNRLACSIKEWKQDEYPSLLEMSDEKVVDWAYNNLPLKIEGDTIIEGFLLNKFGAVIYFDDEEESYNMVNIHIVD